MLAVPGDTPGELFDIGASLLWRIGVEDDDDGSGRSGGLAVDLDVELAEVVVANRLAQVDPIFEAGGEGEGAGRLFGEEASPPALKLLAKPLDPQIFGRVGADAEGGGRGKLEGAAALLARDPVKPLLFELLGSKADAATLPPELFSGQFDLGKIVDIAQRGVGGCLFPDLVGVVVVDTPFGRLDDLVEVGEELTVDEGAVAGELHRIAQVVAFEGKTTLFHIASGRDLVELVEGALPVGRVFLRRRAPRLVASCEPAGDSHHLAARLFTQGAEGHLFSLGVGKEGEALPFDLFDDAEEVEHPSDKEDPFVAQRELFELPGHVELAAHVELSSVGGRLGEVELKVLAQPDPRDGIGVGEGLGDRGVPFDIEVDTGNGKAVFEAEANRFEGGVARLTEEVEGGFEVGGRSDEGDVGKACSCLDHLRLHGFGQLDGDAVGADRFEGEPDLDRHLK